MKYKILTLLITFGLLTVGYSCRQKEIDLKISYDLANPGVELYPDTIPNDSVSLYFSSLYDSDRVKLFVNKRQLFDKTIKTNPVVGEADGLTFKKQKENFLQIEINGQKTKVFKLDTKYNIVYVSWGKAKNQVEFKYLNYMLLCD